MTWTALDTGIVVVAAVSAMASALIGSFLVLRRMSMMGDAISHAVLPGIAVAFLATLSRDTGVIVIGAAVAGVLTAAFTQLIHQVGNVDRGAAMGVVFTTMFAVGLIPDRAQRRLRAHRRAHGLLRLGSSWRRSTTWWWPACACRGRS